MKQLFIRIIKNCNRDGVTKLVHQVATQIFPFVERYLKLHVTPVHFYSPIPTTYELDSEIFDKRYECEGLDWNLCEQLRYLEEIFPKYRNEYEPKPNVGLSLVDAFILYAMIRENKPGVMVEVGAGASTMISLLALQLNREIGHPYDYYSVEPYPKSDVREVTDPNFFLLEKKVQDVDIDLLSSADFLFIDSSHVSKFDSDVNREILEVIPKLKIGSVVHWHDIVIPMNYWREWIYDGNKFWNESYMVHSFMLFNDAFRIIWASRYMQLEYFDKIQGVFPYLQRDHHLMSFWVQRVK